MSIFRNLFGKKTDFKALVDQGAIIIDVRTPAEFNSGHIQGSKNIPLDQVKGSLSKIKQFNKPVITVCRSGARSAVAESVLSGSGIEAYNGGAWTSLNSSLGK